MNLGNLGSNIASGVGDAVRGALFLTAIANLNWSRGYMWYVELEGVPSPFQRGGVIGLPVTEVTLNLGSFDDEKWEAGITGLTAPSKRTSLGNIQLTMYDDEQQTLFTFFDRWINNIYHPYQGVLPLDEAVKEISIKKLKSTRTTINRYPKPYESQTFADFASSYDSPVGETFRLGASVINSGPATSGMFFLVYPTNTFQQSLDSSSNDLMKLTIELNIAYQSNQDFANVNQMNPVKSIANISGNILEKVANYI